MDHSSFSTFDSYAERGAGEWKAFNAVTHDRVSLSQAMRNYTPKPRKESAIRFGTARMFVLKHS